MERHTSFPDHFRQHHQLPLRIVSPAFGHLPATEAARYSNVRRASYYFFLFMLDGRTKHIVDLQPVEVAGNELLFVLPHQVHELPASKHGTDYFKIGFDEQCLSLLPRQYPFLIDPLNSQKITFSTEVASRLQSVFYMLTQLLKDWNAPSELVLAYLNSLLTEINAAYFAAQRKVSDAKLSKYIDFKIFIENNLTDHPTISQVAEALAVNTNGLYHIVKHYSGLSPKEFIINRLITEARRRLYYIKGSSVKDLAFELGFNDPEYFSRLFKKVTGKTITGFFHDLSGN